MAWHGTERPSQGNGMTQNDMELLMTRNDMEPGEPFAGLCNKIYKIHAQIMTWHGTEHGDESKGMAWHGTENQTYHMTRHDTEQARKEWCMTWHDTERCRMSMTWHGMGRD